MDKLTAHGCGGALDGEEDGEDGVGDAVVDHVAVPLDFDVAAGAAQDVDTVHDAVVDACARDFLVGLLYVHAVAVDLFAVYRLIFDLLFVNGAKGAFERPADEVNARC